MCEIKRRIYAERIDRGDIKKSSFLCKDAEKGYERLTIMVARVLKVS